MIAGVCAGLSDSFGINLIFTRVVFIVLCLAQGIGVALYLILMIVIPARPQSEAAGSAVTCPQQNPRKSFFAYLAGALSILVGALTFLNNASSAVELIRDLMSSINSNRISAVSSEPLSLSREATVIDPVLSLAPQIIGIQGSARVVWDAGGVTFQGDIEMYVQHGAASVIFQDPQTLGEITVHQRLSLEREDQELFLVGSEPSRASYVPDM
jgi:phage shock protein PspC (stress-responsive transcriptional regulator)